mmetsp:Transcript_10808/g.28596  ORF Transcript_10808/g.28596 Transcript_10808/m.28596 type:complete len:275 (-) Transcript_10808:89-913(-)
MAQRLCRSRRFARTAGTLRTRRSSKGPRRSTRTRRRRKLAAGSRLFWTPLRSVTRCPSWSCGRNGIRFRGLLRHRLFEGLRQRTTRRGHCSFPGIRRKTWRRPWRQLFARSWCRQPRRRRLATLSAAPWQRPLPASAFPRKVSLIAPLPLNRKASRRGRLLRVKLLMMSGTSLATRRPRCFGVCALTSSNGGSSTSSTTRITFAARSTLASSASSKRGTGRGRGCWTCPSRLPWKASQSIRLGGPGGESTLSSFARPRGPHGSSRAAANLGPPR